MASDPCNRRITLEGLKARFSKAKQGYSLPNEPTSGTSATSVTFQLWVSS
jgi:hypothetical protein